MNKKTLKYIKNDMWEVLYNKKYVQAGLKAELKELEADRKRVLAGYAKSEDKLFRTVSSIMVNERYDRLRVETIQNQIAGWHSDQSYYLIYQDRSEVCITAEDILNGEKFPSMCMLNCRVLMNILTQREENSTGTPKKCWRLAITIMR